MPEAAIRQHLLQATENLRNLAPDYRNKKPPWAQPRELAHREVVMRKQRRSRPRRRAPRQPRTPDMASFHRQEQEWILTRKRAKKNQCKISATKPILYRGQAVNQPTILI